MGKWIKIEWKFNPVCILNFAMSAILVYNLTIDIYLMKLLHPDKTLAVNNIVNSITTYSPVSIILFPLKQIAEIIR